MKTLTPLRTIRQECLHCCGNSSDQVSNCYSNLCKFHPYRRGKIRKGADRRILRQIRLHCLDCVGTVHEVRKCNGNLLDGTKCWLHRYRFGKRPKSQTEKKT